MARTPAGSPRARLVRAGAATAALLTLVAAGAPAPEPVGVGDRLFPVLGNPGYDVLQYDLAFRYGGDNTRPLAATTRITARATAGPLSRLHLDFNGGRVDSVHVNGEPARYRSAGEDLVVTPARPLERNRPLRVEVRHTSPTDVPHGGWIRTRDGLALAPQPDGAHRVFPSNDHPSDKARFTLTVTAPAGLTVVAGGRAVGTARRGGSTVWRYRITHPMATELLQLSIGRSAVLHARGQRGLPLRHVVPRPWRARLKPWLDRTPEQLEWLERRLGRYPFENYGVLAVEATTGYAMETQTLSLFARRFLTSAEYRDWYKESVMVHELAHQWFGNCVTPRRWDDLWLSEGHATWYEWLYAERAGGTALRDRVREAHRASDGWRDRYGPPAAQRAAPEGERPEVFRPVVYEGAALALYALRERMGAAAFERLERRWVTEHRHGNASTADFVALASEVAGRDLSGFLRGWLYGERTPPLPRAAR
ncbi:M1 family peptidase [Streptomyces sp. AJS327]|uniref:M1 family metallopeptidase n=1 Tax=Streptomyces sp. AJS327 TaxID=2545265 RepID=UPI0015DE8EC2|nr:M1 family metallopeptidase [Streptomyces sp. AJS327]MBA0051955.1 M1 family peptidase [Streptomyces sp. AJS327]